MKIILTLILALVAIAGHGQNFNEDSTKFSWCAKCDTLQANPGYKLVMSKHGNVYPVKIEKRHMDHVIPIPNSPLDTPMVWSKTISIGSRYYFRTPQPDTIRCWFKEVVIAVWNRSDLPKLTNNENAYFPSPDTVFIERWQHGYLIRNLERIAVLQTYPWIQQLTYLYADRKTVVKNHVIYYIQDSK